MDPNAGGVSDAIRVFCKMEGDNTETCLEPQEEVPLPYLFLSFIKQMFTKTENLPQPKGLVKHFYNLNNNVNVFTLKVDIK